jgi:hypothetical protein
MRETDDHSGPNAIYKSNAPEIFWQRQNQSCRGGGKIVLQKVAI